VKYRRAHVHALRVVAIALCAAAASTVAVVAAAAQDAQLSALGEQRIPGLEATPEELEAWRLADGGRQVKARELAERIVRRHPSSYVGHFVLGYVQHYAEANFPRALYHLDIALRLYERRWGGTPSPVAPWRWHARMLRELAAAHGDLEHHSEKLGYIARYNLLYDPKMLAERAWPLMKLGRYREARAAARSGIATTDPWQREVALNALCAIEFEAGNDGASYVACKRAMDEARTQPDTMNAVDFTNFAEASRSLFKLDEAERITLEATRAQIAWYGNPWMELAELYTREGRFAEALNALREIPRYRMERPPHVRDADRNETRRALSAFFVVVGRPWDAIRITAKALVAPDRRAHNSRDPAQDLSIAALLDRRARLLAAEMTAEEAVGRPIHERLWADLRAGWLRVEAWQAGRQAARLLADDARLVGMFRIGTAQSAVIPPWLAGELVEVAGAGVVREAVGRARRRDRRAGAAAYYDAFDAEAALAEGDSKRAYDLATRALARLGRAEVLLRARVEAIAAAAASDLGRTERALVLYDTAFQSDPGIFRRLGLEVPVRIHVHGGEVAEEVASFVAHSPRFDEDDQGLDLRIDANGRGGRACLVGVGGSILGCGRAEAKRGDDAQELARRIVQDLHATAFAPRVDLSQADANSLDGSNRIGRDPLRTLFDDDAADPSGGGGGP